MTTPNPELDSLREELRALRAQVERPRRTRLWWLIPVLGLTSTFALADLVPFTANTPAIAADVNANFQQLKTWIEAKTGLVTQSGITTSSLTVGSAGAVTLTTNGTGQLVASGGLALADTTGISSNRFGVTAAITQVPTASTFASGFLESTFVDNGGTIVIMASATGYCTTPGRITMQLNVDGQSQGRMRVLCNAVNLHMAFPATFVRLNRTNLTAFPATRTVRLEPINCVSGCSPGLVTTVADVNDFGEVTVLRLPTP